MVQVLPAVPSFGTQLAQVLGEAGGNIGQGLVQRQQNQKDEQILSSLNAQSSPQEIFQAYSRLSPTKQKALETSVGQLIKGQFTNQQAQQKTQQEDQVKQQELEGWKNTFQDLRERISYTGSTEIPFTKSFAGNIGFTNAAKEREFFDVTAFQLEKWARNEHTKGTLSNQLYQSLLSKLPSSELSEKKNLGRIEAWEDAILKNGKFGNQSPQSKSETQGNEPSRSEVSVYDSSGKHIGFVDKKDARSLPKGYTYK